LAKSLFKKIQSLVVLFFILSSTIIAFSFLPPAEAQTAIISINPTSGNVGGVVAIRCNVSTVNGTYEVYWDDLIRVANGTAVNNSATAEFTVPQAIAGNHTIKLVDVAGLENATINFIVVPSYSLAVDIPELPTHMQEGDVASINVTVNGCNPNATIAANIAIQDPNEVSHAKLFNVSTSSLGTGSAIAAYPTDFVSANTSFVGKYEVSLNTTLATTSFSLGLTKSTEYHRDEAVDIKALYQPNENVTITITGKDATHSANVTADVTGIVHYNTWTVPSTTSIGSFTVNVTSITTGGTVKSPPDIEVFLIPGFTINMTAKNLAGDLVADVNVTAFENDLFVDSKTSNSDGVAKLKLERGNYTCKAYFQNETVGEMLLNVTSATSSDFYCNLTNLGVLVLAVADETELQVPGANLNLTRALTPQTLENQTVTDFSGSAVIHSLLPNSSYVLNVSRYSVQFNTTTIPSLLVDGNVVAWLNVTVICPNFSLQVNVTDGNSQPINNVRVEIHESMGGLYAEANTNADGQAVFTRAFGRYIIKVYDSDGIELNETTLDLFENQNVSLLCHLYGLTFSVRVVDYFGQPISNVNVTLQRETQQLYSARTQADGQATFNGLTGGTLQATVYHFDQPNPFLETTLTVNGSTSATIKVEKYVVLVGMFVETGQFALLIIGVLALILVLSIEIYRRKRVKAAKTEE
jgi:hypothetical protein